MCASLIITQKVSEQLVLRLWFIKFIPINIKGLFAQEGELSHLL